MQQLASTREHFRSKRQRHFQHSRTYAVTDGQYESEVHAVYRHNHGQPFLLSQVDERNVQLRRNQRCGGDQGHRRQAHITILQDIRPQPSGSHSNFLLVEFVRFSRRRWRTLRHIQDGDGLCCVTNGDGEWILGHISAKGLPLVRGLVSLPSAGA